MPLPSFLSLFSLTYIAGRRFLTPLFYEDPLFCLNSSFSNATSQVFQHLEEINFGANNVLPVY